MPVRNVRKQRTKKKLSYKDSVLVVFRSNKNILAQILEPETKKTLTTVSSCNIKKGTKTERAEEVGKKIAEQAKKLKIGKLVFDRNGYLYHGRVKALAEAVRKEGVSI